jgi:hypothetical protein
MAGVGVNFGAGFGQATSFGSPNKFGANTTNKPAFGQTNFQQLGTLNSGSQGLNGFGQTQRRQEMWAGAQKLREIRLAYAPLLDHQGEPIPEGRGIPPIQNDYCEFYRWVYNPRDQRLMSNVAGPTHLGQRRLWEVSSIVHISALTAVGS